MSDQVPDLYADAVQIGLGPFGVVLMLGMQPGQPGAPPIRTANVRMSLEHAKVLSILLKRQLKQFEEQMGEDIPLHPQLCTQLGISKTEDW
jgi:hypothetical protein